MDDRKYWIQLALTILVPFITGAGLVQIKEHLPNWLFLLFLSVLCIFITVVLLRLAFGDWFRRAWIWWKKRTAYNKRIGLAMNWRQKFSDLADIIVRVGSNAWVPNSDESDRYGSLRAWFIINRSELLPMWSYFMRTRIKSSYRRDTNSLEYKIIHEHYEDPFSFFYDPITLDRIGPMLLITVGENDPHRINYVLARINDRTSEFVHWVEYEYKKY